jgi:hypothetical protein
MRKWLVVAFLLGVLTVPFSAGAQGQIKLDSLEVQLWPEYDQPSMLIINYITLSPDTALPATLVFHLPAAADKPSALAVGQTLATVSDQGIEYSVSPQGDYLDLTVKATAPAIQLEYYDPIQKNGTNREYLYKWLTDYQIDSFALTLQQPVDATNLTTSPALPSSETRSDNMMYFSNDFGPLTAGQQFTLRVNYTKTSDSLSVAQQNVQPSEPLSSNTPGRVMLSNYLPYILGGLGLILIAGGLTYFWRSGQGGKTEGRRRHPAKEDELKSDVYCHQCGTRAQAGDRFCRVCGTKLRLAE